MSSSRSTRLWISAATLVVLLVAMYGLNRWSERPKPPPDVVLEGRLAQPMPQENEEPASENMTAPGNAESGEPTAPLKVTTPAEDEKSLVNTATGSVVKLETSKGAIYLNLFDNKTPITVGNFLELVGRGFYDGLKFHRVIANFMIQGGDPNGDGSGGPGFTIPDEADKGLKHVRGSLSMAKTNAPNTGGSQFFICHSPQSHLDGVHTVFGECIKGMDVVDKIQVGDTITKAVILKKSPQADDAVKQAKKARVPEA